MAAGGNGLGNGVTKGGDGDKTAGAEVVTGGA